MEFVEESGGWMVFEKELLLFENQIKEKVCVKSFEEIVLFADGGGFEEEIVDSDGGVKGFERKMRGTSSGIIRNSSGKRETFSGEGGNSSGKKLSFAGKRRTSSGKKETSSGIVRTLSGIIRALSGVSRTKHKRSGKLSPFGGNISKEIEYKEVIPIL